MQYFYYLLEFGVFFKQKKLVLAVNSTFFSKKKQWKPPNPSFSMFFNVFSRKKVGFTAKKFFVSKIFPPPPTGFLILEKYPVLKVWEKKKKKRSENLRKYFGRFLDSKMRESKIGYNIVLGTRLTQNMCQKIQIFKSSGLSYGRCKKYS